MNNDTRAYEAVGFPAGDTPAFVAVNPLYNMRDARGSHVQVGLYMPPTAARQLAYDLLAAADKADGVSVEATEP